MLRGRYPTVASANKEGPAPGRTSRWHPARYRSRALPDLHRASILLVSATSATTASALKVMIGTGVESASLAGTHIDSLAKAFQVVRARCPGLNASVPLRSTPSMSAGFATLGKRSSTADSPRQSKPSHNDKYNYHLPAAQGCPHYSGGCGDGCTAPSHDEIVH